MQPGWIDEVCGRVCACTRVTYQTSRRKTRLARHRFMPVEDAFRLQSRIRGDVGESTEKRDI